MKILVFGTFYSEGMGYAENCLPKSLSKIGNEVHLVTSNLNVYGDQEIYDQTYKSFLGTAKQEIGISKAEDVTIHRLKSKKIFGYILVLGLFKKIKEIRPDIIHSTEICSLNSYIFVLMKLFFRFKFFTETHQHYSVVKPYLKQKGNYLKKVIYKLTRTIPTYLTSFFVEKCFAIAPDCINVANKFYGVPKGKLYLQSLGTDTDLFKPLTLEKRQKLRLNIGYKDTDIVCIYTGRFSNDKNPLLLAKAIHVLSKSLTNFYGIFIGDGIQKTEISNCSNVLILPFMKHSDLVNYYGLSDIAIWPTQESMSMLDAAACGLPLIVSNKIGEKDRIDGNGVMYEENNLESLIEALRTLFDKNVRDKKGSLGKTKMVDSFSWQRIAENIQKDYLDSFVSSI